VAQRSPLLEIWGNKSIGLEMFEIIRGSQGGLPERWLINGKLKVPTVLRMNNGKILIPRSYTDSQWLIIRFSKTLMGLMT